MDDIRIERWDEAACVAGARALVDLYARLWPDDDWSGFADKLGGRPGLSAVVALDGDGRIAAAKLGWNIRRDIHYSWLGGVREDRRRTGLAERLMAEQHAWLTERGLEWVETATRQPNAAMAILNLKSGFVVVGLDAAPGEPTKVIFRKRLSGG